MNRLQKGEKPANSVNKLVGKVSINLLHHAKSAIYIISIIIDAPAIAYAMVSRQALLSMLYTYKQIDLTSMFLTTAALFC